MSGRRNSSRVLTAGVLALLAAVTVLLAPHTWHWPATDPAVSAPAGTSIDAHAAEKPDQRSVEVATRFRNAVMMLHAQQYDYAVTALHRVLELAPRLPEAHVNMGYALLGLGRAQAARDFFLGAIELRPAQANAYWGLAVSLEALCDIDAAKGAMRTYIHLSAADDQYLPRARAALWEWEAGDEPEIPGCHPGEVLQ